MLVVMGACAGEGPTLASPSIVVDEIVVTEHNTGADNANAAPAHAAMAEVLPATQTADERAAGERVTAGQSTEAADSTQTADALAIPVVAFVIAPDAPLLDVAIGAPLAEALPHLTDLLGEPDEDSDWYQGCPKGGIGNDERLVQWGDLNVYFERSGSAGVLVAWGFDLRRESNGLPGIDSLYLPGGATLGDPIEDVADSAGLGIIEAAEFGVTTVGVAGYEILANNDPGAPTWGAFVPAIPRCV
jgi:hypothetical protein